MKIHVRKLHCFHPEGKDEPNGICYARGFYWKAVGENYRKLRVPENGAFGAVIMLPKGAEPLEGKHTPYRKVFTSVSGLFTGTFPFNGYTFDSDSECFVLFPPRTFADRFFGKRAYVRRAIREFSKAYGCPVVGKIADKKMNMYLSFVYND